MKLGSRTPVSRRADVWRSAVLLVMASALALGGVQATPVAASSLPSVGPVKQPEKTAAQRAAESGQPVEVIEKRSESSKTFANPDGTFTLEQSAVPVRKKRDGQWVDLDPTLARDSDDIVRPAATAMDMEFSGGGNADLATLFRDGHELRLKWPDPLPEPLLSGDNLTYKSVYPGVDLRLNVTKDSFTQVLIVHTPEAAKLPQLQEIELGLEAPGLTVRSSPGGGLEAIDVLDAVVFSAPKPAMWDSAGDGRAEPASADRAEAPLEGDTVASMPIEVRQDSMAVTPVRSLADAPSTVYPLHIDPPFSGPRIARSMINEHYPSTPYWGWGGDEGVGYQSFEPWSRKRLFFGFSVGKVAGAEIISATFNAFETWTASCTPKVVEVWKTARVTENTNWSSGSGSSVWQQRLAIATVAHGRDGCNPGGYWVPFNVTSAVAQQAAANASTVYLGMRAADESDQNAWKRFRYDVVLSINYNLPPTVHNPHTIDPAMSCATSATNDPVIGDQSPRLMVSVADPDSAEGDHVQAYFEIRRAVDVAPFWNSWSESKAGGLDVEFEPTKALLLSTNTTYVWRARGFDGRSYSAWSTPCYFAVDVTRPPAPQITFVTQAPYQVGEPITVRFSTSTTDVVGYRYSLNDDAMGPGTIPVSSGTATFTPTHFGPQVVRAWAVDQAGNSTWTPNQATRDAVDGPEIGRWLMDEGSGTSTADSTGNGHLMYLGPTVEWHLGDKGEITTPVDHALFIPGLQTSGATTATAQSNIVDSTQNFSVMARVKPAIKSNRQVIVGEDRPGMSSFMLGTTEMSWQGKDTADTSDDDPNDRQITWSFKVATTTGPVEVKSKPLTYLADAIDEKDKWVHLVGTYTRGSRVIGLYVDGEVAGSASLPIGSVVIDGTGPFRTGLGIDGSAATHFYRGFIDDVSLYDGKVSDARIHALGLGD